MNAVLSLGIGDFHDRERDVREAADEAIERESAELYADDQEVSEALCDFLSYLRGHRNDPKVLEAINALRDGDHLHFGTLCAQAVDKRLDQKAEDNITDRKASIEPY